MRGGRVGSVFLASAGKRMEGTEGKKSRSWCRKTLFAELPLKKGATWKFRGKLYQTSGYSSTAKKPRKNTKNRLRWDNKTLNLTAKPRFIQKKLLWEEESSMGEGVYRSPQGNLKTFSKKSKSRVRVKRPENEKTTAGECIHPRSRGARERTALEAKTLEKKSSRKA